MKLKTLVLTALSLASLALSAAPASAWWLHRNHGINRYSTVVVCRPYNAFTPVCAGSLVCDGCCPFSCPQLPRGAACGPVLGNPLLAMCHDPVGMNAAARQMQPMMMQAPMMGMPQQVPMNLQAQMPMTYPVMPAGYQPSMTPVYYPIMPAPMSVPAYWYGN